MSVCVCVCVGVCVCVCVGVCVCVQKKMRMVRNLLGNDMISSIAQVQAM